MIGVLAHPLDLVFLYLISCVPATRIFRVQEVNITVFIPQSD